MGWWCTSYGGTPYFLFAPRLEPEFLIVHLNRDVKDTRSLCSMHDSGARDQRFVVKGKSKCLFLFNARGEWGAGHFREVYPVEVADVEMLCRAQDDCDGR
jgi:hypothetical protein